MSSPSGCGTEPARGSFALRGLPEQATANVLGEDRDITIRKGEFADDFTAYGVHIYEITPGSAARPIPRRSSR